MKRVQRKRMGRTTEDVQVLAIIKYSMTEDGDVVVASNVKSLIDYVVNEVLPEQGYDAEDIEDMGVESALAEDFYWEDPEGVQYIILKSKMVG